MRFCKSIAPVLVLVGLLAVVGWADENGGHPEVDSELPCDVCHAEMTPDIHDQWFAGRHGLNNVKCFICHGTFDKDFVRTPDSFRCVGCHAEQVASYEASGVETKNCFSCHPPHLLSPHVSAKPADGGEQ